MVRLLVHTHRTGQPNLGRNRRPVPIANPGLLPWAAREHHAPPRGARAPSYAHEGVALSCGACHASPRGLERPSCRDRAVRQSGRDHARSCSDASGKPYCMPLLACPMTRQSRCQGERFLRLSHEPLMMLGKAIVSRLPGGGASEQCYAETSGQPST